MRGVRFDLVDAKFHPDSVHRRPNNVVPAAARAFQAAFLMADPCLYEPIYEAEIIGESGSLNGVYSVLGQRNATIVDIANTAKSDQLKALLPVRCAIGLADSLRFATKGRAYCSCVYRGMKLVPENETDARNPWRNNCLPRKHSWTNCKHTELIFRAHQNSAEWRHRRCLVVCVCLKGRYIKVWVTETSGGGWPITADFEPHRL